MTRKYCPSDWNPYDEDYPCQLCGGYEEMCECECPVCGAWGQRSCIEEHGMAVHVIPNIDEPDMTPDNLFDDLPF